MREKGTNEGEIVKWRDEAIDGRDAGKETEWKEWRDGQGGR